MLIGKNVLTRLDPAICLAVRRLLLWCIASSTLLAADWPMWRYDAGRSAASPEKLPAELHLQWVRQYSQREQVWDDPLNHDLMPYDKVFEPIVLGDRLFLGFNDTDKVVALDTRTGREIWAFYTDGPVRFPPVAWQNKVYFTSDDGCLYCVGADKGGLKWKFRGGPSERKVLGNKRMISAWPARGGPVIRDGRVYFAASIWPFMGIFIYALDAQTGQVVWVNDGSGAQFIKQPHSAPSFAGVAPQGAFVATQDILLVPGGRSVPAAFDRATGEYLYFHINDGGKGNGGSFVAASDEQFFVHTRGHEVRPYDLKTGKSAGVTHGEPVLEGSIIYAASADGSILHAVDTTKEVPFEVEAFGLAPAKWALELLWEIPVDASRDLIKAGDRLYAAGTNAITAIEAPAGKGEARVAWQHSVEGGVERILAANGQLFAVTLDGRIMAFGGTKPAAPPIIPSERRAPALIAEGGSLQKPAQSNIPAAMEQKAQAMLNEAEARDGWALWFGVEEPELLEALLRQSNVRIVAVEADAAKVDKLRRHFDTLGLYGQRVTFHLGDPSQFKAPPYVANLVVIEGAFLSEMRRLAALQIIYEAVRPYGGVLWLSARGALQEEIAKAIRAAHLEKGQLTATPSHLIVRREGKLPHAADWTHQYGDIGNTVKSDDARVRAPLGLLWFGGTSNMDVLPRHGHGPPEQVIGGRVFIQGMNSISARDVYTGRLLWKRDFESLGTFGIYYDASYTNTPLSTAYNQKHIPGANGRGSNMVATEDAVYLVIGSECQLLDVHTGQTRQTFSLPPRPDQTERPQWGFLGIYEDLLLGGDDFAHYTQKFAGSADTNKTATIEDYSASDGLAALNRRTGEVLWRVKARHSFIHNGIVAGNGRIYCLDKLPGSAEEKRKRRGLEAPKDYRILCLDAKTGQILWETQENIFGSWLGYSKQHDALLLAGAKATDRMKDEVGEGMTVYRGHNGAILWQDLKRAYTGPCILHNDLILTSANAYQASSGAFNLLDGSPYLIPNPLTGKLEPWRVSRAYGCNSIVASENLLTFRSGAAGFYDLLSKSGTGNLGGFKSGCTANLVVANGVLNAPDYTRTCSCSYQNQTSLAMVHMPDMEMWTYSQFGLDAEEGDRIERVGINFGAPGDRRSEDGTLWLEYPSVGGDSPNLTIQVNGSQTNYFRRHASQVSGGGLSWVAASGVRDVESVTIIPEILRHSAKAATDEDDEDEDEKPAKKKNSKQDGKSKKAADKSKTATVKPERLPHPPAPYTVKLHFIEPDDLPPGQRVFSLSVQGERRLEKFDIAKVAGGTMRPIVKEFQGVIIEKALELAFHRDPSAKAGPVLCGVELIAERPNTPSSE